MVSVLGVRSLAGRGRVVLSLCLGGSLAPLAPNARFQLLGMAGARYERRLFPVSCKPLFGGFLGLSGFALL